MATLAKRGIDDSTVFHTTLVRIDWHSPDAVNYPLRELAVDTKGSPEFIRKFDPLTFEPEDFGDNVLVTACDTKKNRRIILDGTHRAVILTNESNMKLLFPSASIIECYGDEVDRLFPFDLGHSGGEQNA